MCESGLDIIRTDFFQVFENELNISVCIAVGFGMIQTQPQHVQQITVRNGYVRSSKDAQVFEHNGRIKRVRVSTDSGREEWTMKDTPEAQSWRVDLGVTARVEFEVLEVYPGSKYQDLALTDIGFDAGG